MRRRPGSMSAARAASLDAGDQAAVWVARLAAPDCDAGDRAGFALWLEASPKNVRAYVQSERLHQAAAALARDEALQAEARQALRRSRYWTQPEAPMSAPLAVAVSSLLVGLLTAGWLCLRPHHHSTDADRQSHWNSPHAIVAAKRRIVAVFDGPERTRPLWRQGFVGLQALADPRQGLLGQAGAGFAQGIGAVMAIGERKDAARVGRHQDGAALPAYSETDRARPRYRPRLLHAGDGERPGRDARQDPPVSAAAEGGDLVFKDERLDAVLEQMNRHSALKLRLANPEIGHIAVSGVFHLGDQRALLDALELGWALEAEAGPGGEIVLRRSPE